MNMTTLLIRPKLLEVNWLNIAWQIVGLYTLYSRLARRSYVDSRQLPLFFAHEYLRSDDVRAFPDQRANTAIAFMYSIIDVQLRTLSFQYDSWFSIAMLI